MSKKEPELKDLENSYPIHILKSENVWKIILRVWLFDEETSVSVNHRPNQPHQQKQDMGLC